MAMVLAVAEVGVKAGYKTYTDNNFDTSLDVISGLGYSRSDFGLVMESQIQECASAGSSAPNPTPFVITVESSAQGARFFVDVPANTSLATYAYAYWGGYDYEYEYGDGDDVPFSFYTLPLGTNFTYKVYSNGVEKASDSFSTLL